MKLPLRVERDEYGWHRWFAWHPVDVGTREAPDRRWMEWVERKKIPSMAGDVSCLYYLDYRPVQK